MEICPFYGQAEDECDVGSGYISTHDVQRISTHCATARYCECDKYQELRYSHPLRAVNRVEIAQTTARTRRPQQIMQSKKPIKIAFRNNWPLNFRLRYTLNNPSIMDLSPKEEIVMQQKSMRKAWTVVLAGTGINLALGILYTWSIFKGAILDSINTGGEGAFNWDAASVNDPYAVACLAFAVAMILAGKVQDKLGPKITCIIGGLMVGAGFCWISTTSNYWAWVVGFGMLAGTGIGFGYSAATPPALKWFPPAKTGLIAGIVVSGFGLASVYIAPLAKYLLSNFGLQQSMMYFGIAFAVVVAAFGMLISNPPADPLTAPQASSKAVAHNSSTDLSPAQLLTNGKFYILWLCFFIGAGAGLMVIGSAKGLAKASMGEMAFLVVVIMSVGNAAGRLIAGVISDKIGRATTLTCMLVFQAILMFVAIPVLGGGESNPLLVTLLVSFMVFNYGTNLSLFPSFAKDYWGMKHFGMNYGILFSAWGVGAFVLVRVSQMLQVKTGSFTTSFIVAGIMLLVGAMMSRSLQPKKTEVAVEVPQTQGVEEEELALAKAGN